MAGEVKLGHIVGSLCVAHVLAVEPHESGRIDAAEVDQRAARIPAFGQLEGAHVGAYGVDAVVLAAIVEAGTGLDERRGVGVGIFDIGIDGAVVALHFPVGRHGDSVPRGGVEAFFIEGQRTLVGLWHEVETPRAVQAEVAAVHGNSPGRGIVILVGQHGSLIGIGHVGGYARFLVFGKDGFVLPVGGFDLRLFDLFEAEPRRAVGSIVGHSAQLPFAQGIHLVGLGLPGRADDVSVGLSCHRLEAELCIVPHAFGGRPLQQPVDAGIVAAVVKVLSVKGVLHHAAVKVEHLDAPILAAVFPVYGFGHNAGIVLARVAVAQHAVGLFHRTDAIGQRHIEACPAGLHHLEVGQLVGSGLSLGQQHNLVALGCRSHIRAVGRHEQHAVGHGLCLPELGFVRTVVLAGLHRVGLSAHSQVAEGVDETPCSRKLGHHKVLALGGLIGLGQAQCAPFVEGQHQSFGGQHEVIQCALSEGLRRSGAHSQTTQEGHDK